jgi:alpha-N-arabinofuranosidase
MLITLLRHADRVKIACMAQLVNVIAPIMTSDTGAWRQTIYYPYWLTCKYGRGVALQTIVDAPTYENKKYGTVPCIDSVAVYNDERDELVIFAVNKSLTEDIDLTVPLRQFADFELTEHVVLHHEDLYAVNTEAQPNTVVPNACNCSQISDGQLVSKLQARSWNMIRLSRK